MRYKVLWIDDDYKIQSDFIGEAEQEGFDIDAVESHEEGMKLLSQKTEVYHAVILDAKVKKGKDDTFTGLDGLRASRDRLIEINKNGYLPYFIFTGQPDYLTSNVFKESYGKYYIKAKDNDELFRDLKNAIENREEYQIQKKYKNVFDVCTKKYVGTAAVKYLNDILFSIEYSPERFDNEKYFNGLRKVIELVFRASNRLGLLHDKCIPEEIVNLTWSSLYMAGKEVELKPTAQKIRCAKTHFPLLLAENVRSILAITSAASHTESEKENGRINFFEYAKQINSNYLLYSLAFQVIDLLIWYKHYADENPDIEKNKLLWISADPIPEEGLWIKGEVIRIAENGYGTFQPSDGGQVLSIIPMKVNEHKLSLNQKIEVTTKPDNKGTKLLIEQIRI